MKLRSLKKNTKFTFPGMLTRFVYLGIKSGSYTYANEATPENEIKTGFNRNVNIVSPLDHSSETLAEIINPVNHP